MNKEKLIELGLTQELAEKVAANNFTGSIIRQKLKSKTQMDTALSYAPEQVVV